jgi:spore germination protein GerM
MAKKRKKKKKKKKKSSGYLPTIIAAAITIIAGIILIALFSGRFSRPPTPPPSPPRQSPLPSSAISKEIRIYLSSREGRYLRAVSRSIRPGTLTSRIEEALSRLIKDGSPDTIPKGTSLINLGIRQNTVYADFTVEIKTNHPGGSTAEINTVYAIVNTVTLNFPEIKDVQILIEGKKAATLAGHIDISQPIGPQTKIIRPE